MIGTATNIVKATIAVGMGPTNVAVSPNNKYAYVTNEFSQSLSVIDTTNNQVSGTVPLGANPSVVAVAPNGSYIYVALGESGTIKVINTSTAPAANKLLSALDWTILIVAIIIMVVFLIVFAMLRRGRKKIQSTKTA